MARQPSSERAAKARWVTETDGVFGPSGSGMKGIMQRTLADLPADLSPFAREVAILTLHRAVQAKVFQPIMDALKRLETRTDWSGGHLVIEEYDQTWRNAPFKHYGSFADFYQRELETTWGKWTDLQETWRLHIAGRLSEAEKDARIQESRARTMQEKNAKVPDLGFVGRPRKDSDGEKRATFSDERGTSYALRRLRKDRPDIHARVLAGKITANAGMIEAGFRKKAKSRKRSPTDRIIDRLPTLSADQLRRVLQAIEALLNHSPDRSFGKDFK